MRFFPLLALVALLAGCAGRRLPPYEPPLARAPVQCVRTTAYTHSERDHRKHANRSALGTPLKYEPEIRSAAADWARWPAGTRFRIVETGELCEVDDYGWALAGTNTIDLYKPTPGAMRQWGVRRVQIEVLQWGDPWHSYKILKPRGKYAHVKRMLKEIQSFY